MAGFDNIASMIPVLAAGFSKNPGTVTDAINMSRAGRQDAEESKLREFGRILFSSGKMPESEAEIMQAAKAAGVQDFTKVMPMVGNFMKYRQEQEAFKRSKERPFEITDENGNVRRVMANPGEAPEGAIPGQTSYRAPLINLYDSELGEYRVGTQRPGVELGGVPMAAHLQSESQKFQGEQSAIARRAADRRAAASNAASIRAAQMKSERQKYATWVMPDGKTINIGEYDRPPDGAKKLTSGMRIVTNPDGTTSIQTNVAGGGDGNGLNTSVTGKLQDEVIKGARNLSDLQSLAKYIPDVRKYLTIKGRTKKSLLGLKDIVGYEMSADDGKFFDSAGDFQKGIKQWFNAYKKEITGAAGAFAEIEDIRDSVMDWKQGPRAFTAGYNQLVSKAQRLQRLNNKFLREGLSGEGVGSAIDGVWSGGVDDDIDARGNELRDAGYSNARITQTLIDEGYIGME